MKDNESRQERFDRRQKGKGITRRSYSADEDGHVKLKELADKLKKPCNQ